MYRPNTIKVFASDASHGNYLPIKFGTNIPVKKSQYDEVANDNFLFGLESLEGDLQLKDLNSVFFYQGSLLAYLFQQGVPEFSAYQDYPMGAVVQHGGNLWIATKDQKAQKKEPKVNPCDPCGCNNEQGECTVITEPSKESGWCSFVTHCEYDVKMKELDDTNTALQESIDSIKGVEGFNILPNLTTGALELTLALDDGSAITIPMTKFGKFEKVIATDGSVGYKVTNPDGSELELPAHKASTQLIDSDGTSIGFVHIENEKTGAVTNTIGLVRSSELDQNNGFYWDSAAKKWKVDLSDLVKTHSGLEVDRNGFIKVKPSDFVDNESLSVDANTGKVKIKPEYLNTISGNTIEDLDERGAKVFTESPILGLGTKEEPLNLKLSKDFKVNSDGTLTLSGGVKEATTNLNSAVGVMGMSTFFGVVNNRNGNTEYVVGVPSNISSTDYQETSTTTIGQLSPNQDYDFNGWQIATPRQVDQWLIGVSDVVWHRTNESGMNTDGTLKNPNNWGVWTRESNVNIPIQQYQQAVRDIAELQICCNNNNAKNATQDERLTALENCCNNNNSKNTAQDQKIVEIETRLAALKSRNDSLNSENARLSSELSSVRSQLSSANSQVSSLTSQLSSCRSSLSSCQSSLASPANATQAGRLLFNASWLNQGSPNGHSNGWQYADLVINSVSGNSKILEYIEWEVKVTNSAGTEWIAIPNGSSSRVMDTDVGNFEFLGAKGRATVNPNDRSSVVQKIPYKPLDDNYGKVYFNIKVKYEGDPTVYPVGDVLDFIKGDYVEPASGEVFRPFNP